MKTIIIDTVLLNRRGHEYLQECFSFPDYYGKNLDALHDCLSDLQDTEITIQNASSATDFSKAIIQVIVDAALESDDIVLRYEFN